MARFLLLIFEFVRFSDSQLEARYMRRGGRDVNTFQFVCWIYSIMWVIVLAYLFFLGERPVELTFTLKSFPYLFLRFVAIGQILFSVLLPIPFLASGFLLTVVQTALIKFLERWILNPDVLEGKDNFPQFGQVRNLLNFAGNTGRAVLCFWLCVLVGTGEFDGITFARNVLGAFGFGLLWIQYFGGYKVYTAGLKKHPGWQFFFLINLPLFILDISAFVAFSDQSIARDTLQIFRDLSSMLFF
jgi:hypothetical protein